MESDTLLHHPAYSSEVRRGWHGYTRRVNIMSSIMPNDGKALLRRFMPETNKSEHAALAEKHAHAARKNFDEWNRIVDEACVKFLGRPFQFGDYRISGIARDEFDEQTKELLRKHIHTGGAHERLAILHKMAAGKTHRKALEFVRSVLKH